MKRKYAGSNAGGARKRSRASPAATGWRSSAAKVATTNAIKRLITNREEVKYFTGNYAASATTTGAIVDLSAIVQGFNKTQRVGDAVRIKSMHFTWSATAQSGGIVSAADEYNNCRMLFFRWKENSGAIAPVVANILDATSGAPFAMYNFDQRKIYKIVYDRTMTVFNNPVYDGTSVKSFQGNGSVKFSANNNLGLSRIGAPTINFINNSTDGTGKLFALVVGDSSFTPHPTMTLAWTIEYTDA